MKKYLTVMRTSFKNQIIYVGSFLFRNIFFLLVIYIFSRLWTAIYGQDSQMEGITLNQTIWYLCFSETIIIATPGIWRQIQEEVKDGTLAYGLLRPYSYPLFQIFQALGETLMKLIPFLGAGFLVARYLSGPLPGYWQALFPTLILILLGQLSLILVYILIGLSSFWMEEVTPIFWIWQKLLFVLGGTFLPLDFFPPLLRDISQKLPFAYGVYWPSITMVDFSWERWLFVLKGQLLWNGLFSLAIIFLYQRARNRVQVQGG